MSRFLTVAKKVYDTPDRSLNYISLARQVLGDKVYKYGPEQRLYHDKAKLDRMAMFLKNIGELKTMGPTTTPSNKAKGRTKIFKPVGGVRREP